MYKTDFECDFIKRTLELINQYDEEYEATLLLNCLLGLLVLPHEKLERKIPNEQMSKLPAWGIPKTAITCGKCNCDGDFPKTLAHFVQCLRNAVAHFDIKPIHESSKVLGFVFKGRYGFEAKLNIRQLRDFITKLSDSLKP